MTIRSILFINGDTTVLPVQAPDYFHDLHLDQVIDALVANRPEHELRPYFWLPLTSADAVQFRQQAMKELDNNTWRQWADDFAEAMADVRLRLKNAEQLHVALEKQRWFLAAASAYATAIESLTSRLAELTPRSMAFQNALADLRAYVVSAEFKAMAAQAHATISALAGIRFGLIIEGSSVTVHKDKQEPDYTPVIESIFAKFRRGSAKDYRVKFTGRLGVNHIEEQVIDRVAKLYPEPFEAMQTFCEQHDRFFEEVVQRLDRELQFYACFLRHTDPVRQAGLPMCFPMVSECDKTTRCLDGFDLALASTRMSAGQPVVCNDFALLGTERLLVVSGPNQGGKTTFARMVGQIHHLSALGCMVPAREAQLYLCDRIFSHFEREEHIRDLRGKLHDDLLRMHHILTLVTDRSLVVMNESFSSTTVADAVFLSREVLRRLSQLDTLAVCVTFLPALTQFDHKTVSMVGQVDPADPAKRTYKVVRRAADGFAYAMAIARKYRLTRDDIMRRVRS